MALIFYMRESPIWKRKVVILDCVDSFQKLFGGLTWILSHLCEAGSFTTSFSTYVVNSICLPIIGSSFCAMDIKSKETDKTVY